MNVVPSNFIQTTQKLETIQMSINRWLAKQIQYILCNDRIVLSNIKTINLGTYNNMDESQKNHTWGHKVK